MSKRLNDILMEGTVGGLCEMVDDMQHIPLETNMSLAAPAPLVGEVDYVGISAGDLTVAQLAERPLRRGDSSSNLDS